MENKLQTTTIMQCVKHTDTDTLPESAKIYIGKTGMVNQFVTHQLLDAQLAEQMNN